MEKTLINPNQCQYFGIPICDEPTNHHRPLGNEANFNTHIPMSMVGSTCVFITWYPIDNRVETCQHIIISNELYWYPSKHIFKISSIEKEQRSNVFNLRLINQVRIQTLHAPPVTYIQDDMAIHDFYRAMMNFSIWLAQDLIVDRLVGNIRVSMTKKWDATITNEMHHSETPELLARY